MTQAMNEFLCALREAGSPLWEGTHADRAILVNAAAELIEKLTGSQSLDEAVRWIEEAESVIANCEIKWRPSASVN
jgi:hypothetical protein